MTMSNDPSADGEWRHCKFLFDITCGLWPHVYYARMEAKKKFSVALLDRVDLAQGTIGCYFEKPKDFSFLAGQYVDMILKNPPYKDDEGNVRTFTLASSPTEQHLLIATRLRNSAFKNSLKDMPVGAKVEIEGPMGDLVLPKDAARPVVLLAGGIGITPFRSMLKYAADRNLPHRLFLFYSNRRPEDAPFLDELLSWQGVNPRYRCFATMTEIKESKVPWHGLEGYIDAAMIRAHLDEPARAHYYIAGPPAMVTSMRVVLEEMHVPDNQIHTEEFSGY